MQIKLTSLGMKCEKEEDVRCACDGYNQRVSEDEKLCLVVDKENLKRILLTGFLVDGNWADLAEHISKNLTQFIRIEKEK